MTTQKLFLWLSAYFFFVIAIAWRLGATQETVISTVFFVLGMLFAGIAMLLRKG